MRRLISLFGLMALGLLAWFVLTRYRAGDMVVALFAAQLPGCW